MTDSDPFEDLHQAANWARSVLARLSFEGGILEQIANGDWDDGRSPEQARDLADLWWAVAEHVRDARAFSPDLPDVDRLAHIAERHAEDAQQFLPLNRKERFYTGTVLPMLVASEGFAHLHRLLNLCGLGHVELEKPTWSEGRPGVQFFTEYGFAESVFTHTDRARWAGAYPKDTPDVVLTGPGWLLAVEAKMFHNPTAAALNRQMSDQAEVVASWRRVLGLDEDRLAHVLLLPARLHERVQSRLRFPVLTWEQLLATYAPVAPMYWSGLLRLALDRHPELESTGPLFGTNAHGSLTGQQIYDAHGPGGTGSPPDLPFDHVGRADGADGERFAADVATGRWRTTRYEVRLGPVPGNRNWFPVQALLDRVEGGA